MTNLNLFHLYYVVQQKARPSIKHQLLPMAYLDTKKTHSETC